MRLKNLRGRFFFPYNCILSFNFIHWSPAVSLVGQPWDSPESSLWLEKQSTLIDAHTHLWVCAVNVYTSSFGTLVPMNNVLQTCLHKEEIYTMKPEVLIKVASEQNKYKTMHWGNLIKMHFKWQNMLTLFKHIW